jgi:hypothetical protein
VVEGEAPTSTPTVEIILQAVVEVEAGVLVEAKTSQGAMLPKEAGVEEETHAIDAVSPVIMPTHVPIRVNQC